MGTFNASICIFILIAVVCFYERAVHKFTERVYRKSYSSENSFIANLFSKNEVRDFDEILEMVLRHLEAEGDESFDTASALTCQIGLFAISKRCLKVIVRQDLEEAVYGGYLRKSASEHFRKGRMRHVEIFRAR